MNAIRTGVYNNAIIGKIRKWNALWHSTYAKKRHFRTQCVQWHCTCKMFNAIHSQSWHMRCTLAVKFLNGSVTISAQGTCWFPLLRTHTEDLSRCLAPIMWLCAGLCGQIQKARRPMPRESPSSPCPRIGKTKTGTCYGAFGRYQAMPNNARVTIAAYDNRGLKFLKSHCFNAETDFSTVS